MQEVFTSEHLQRIEEGLRLFNEQKYWECHEVLEDLWMEERNDNARYVYWAIIQIAAVCIHYRNENIVGARGMLAKAKEKFRRCRELHLVTPFLLENLNWMELENLVEEVPEGKDSKLDNFRGLFLFRFKPLPGGE